MGNCVCCRKKAKPVFFQKCTTGTGVANRSNSNLDGQGEPKSPDPNGGSEPRTVKPGEQPPEEDPILGTGTQGVLIGVGNPAHPPPGNSQP